MSSSRHAGNVVVAAMIASAVLGAPGCSRDGALVVSSDALGRCGATPRKVASTSGAGGALLLDGDFVYWQTGYGAGDSTIWRSERVSGTTVAFAAGDRMIGVDSGRLAWTGGADMRLHATDTATGSDVDLGVSLADYEGAYDAPLLALAGGYVLWGDGVHGGGSFYSLAIDGGGSPVRHALGAGWVDATAWTASAATTLYVAGDELWRASTPDAASPTSLGKVGGGVEILAVGTEDAYLWTAGGLERVALADGATTALAVAAVPPDDALCGGMVGKYGGTLSIGPDGTVYETESTDCLDASGGRAYSIWRASGQAKRYAGYRSELATAPTLAVDDACLYWLQDDAAAGSESAPGSASLMTIALAP